MTDVSLCPDCEEVVEGWTFHPACCGHDRVESSDDASGEVEPTIHRWTHFCHDCGEYVWPEMTEDGGTAWLLVDP
jgi:hypothetical protein